MGKKWVVVCQRGVGVLRLLADTSTTNRCCIRLDALILWLDLESVYEFVRVIHKYVYVWWILMYVSFRLIYTCDIFFVLAQLLMLLFFNMIIVSFRAVCILLLFWTETNDGGSNEVQTRYLAMSHERWKVCSKWLIKWCPKQLIKRSYVRTL